MVTTNQIRAVFAVGGNALIRAGEKGTISEQRANSAALSSILRRFIDNQSQFHTLKSNEAKFSSCLVHGNGPQVGNIQRQQEAVASEIPAFTIDHCVAMTQGSIGYLIQRSLANEYGKEKRNINISTLVTEVIVDKTDPAIGHPTKMVGRFYPRDTAMQLQQFFKWEMVEEPGKGWRQIVPSPVPLKIVQAKTISDLMESGNFVIAAGGGGIPIAEGEDGEMEGLDAVLDKDMTAAKLADEIGAKLLVLCTNVDKVCLNFGKSNEKAIDAMTSKEAYAYHSAGHFHPGSMGSKINAALQFLSVPGREVLIATPAAIASGNPTTLGTRIHS